LGKNVLASAVEHKTHDLQMTKAPNDKAGLTPPKQKTLH